MNVQLRRTLLDVVPAALFALVFFVLTKKDFYTATAVLMVSVLAALAIGYWFERRLLPMPLFIAAMVMVFGGLTLYLHSETFLKVKLTAIYGFFGVLLLGGLAFNRLFIKYLFAAAFELDEAGWRKLTLRWGVFFLCLAALNEAVWRTTSTATWVLFKFWGVIPLVFLFTLAQTPLLMKHQLNGDAQE